MRDGAIDDEGKSHRWSYFFAFAGIPVAGQDNVEAVTLFASLGALTCSYSHVIGYFNGTTCHVRRKRTARGSFIASFCVEPSGRLELLFGTVETDYTWTVSERAKCTRLVAGSGEDSKLRYQPVCRCVLPRGGRGWL